ncbi:hypothetical protein FSPOR_9169 [Fusarium sporotrichioides]|uniref:Uncharacterized protein n=1 Tax=Fusarium sporotrichioides TaxID=5514 RepID=A0A395RR26_FUSSP|nr:hypothetical protein FSPOR_9169 [Fusarium sporotrichioides]
MEVEITDASSWSTESCSELDLGTTQVKPKIVKLAQLARTVAVEKPDDENAQRRAQAATAMVAQVTASLLNSSVFPPSEGDEDAHPSESGKQDLSSLDSAKRSVRDHTSLPEPSHRTRTWLPTEIYQLIIGHIDELHGRSKQNTLYALSYSCKILARIAERFLYAHPRGLKNVEQQWMFLYSLRLEPTRAAYIKSLELICPSDATNMDLLINIASSCPNVKDLLVERGDSMDDAHYLSKAYTMYIGSLLSACSPLETLRYQARASEVYPDPEAFDDDDLDEQGNLSAPLTYPGFKETGPSLKRLSIGDSSDWLIQLMAPHLSSNLTSLTIGPENNPTGETPLTILAGQCPHLQELILEYTLVESSDLEQACKRWGSTLRTLKVAHMEEDSDWLAEIMPSMTALKNLDSGMASACLTSDIEGIAQSTSPLEQIVLGYIECRGDGAASDEMNSALANMIAAHSARLRFLELGNTKMGPPLLKSCKKARHLMYLDFQLAYRPLASEIDDLLVACPELDIVTWRLTQYSLQRGIWEARMHARVPPVLEAVQQDP